MNYNLDTQAFPIRLKEIPMNLLKSFLENKLLLTLRQVHTHPVSD